MQRLKTFVAIILMLTLLFSHAVFAAPTISSNDDNQLPHDWDDDAADWTFEPSATTQWTHLRHQPLPGKGLM